MFKEMKKAWEISQAFFISLNIRRTIIIDVLHFLF